MKLPPLHSLVSVEWEDIVVDADWVDKDKIGNSVSPPHPVQTYGYLSFISDAYVVISSTMSANSPDQYNNHISLPLGCITEIKTFKV